MSAGPRGSRRAECRNLITDDLGAALKAGDVAIDFTHPEASLDHVRVCAEHKKPIVIGTTGFTKEQLDRIHTYVQAIPCVLSPNMSIGVNLTFRILAEVARTLGDEYDIEIVEAHHRMKKDAPSGTAMKMAQVLAQAVHRNLDEVGVYARKGMIGERSKRDRYPDGPGRRHRGRAHGDVRGQGRAHRDNPPGAQQGHLCRGRRPGGQVDRREETRPVRHAGRAGAEIERIQDA